MRQYKARYVRETHVVGLVSPAGRADVHLSSIFTRDYLLDQHASEGDRRRLGTMVKAASERVVCYRSAGWCQTMTAA